MSTDDPAIVLRLRIAKHLQRAYDALTDERLNPQDALAVARNIATTVTAEVDTMGGSPAFS
jgi:hypothetical protein